MASEKGDGEMKEPRDVRTVRGILRSMGVEDYDEHVVHQLHELLYRHVSVVATEAESMAKHSGRDVAEPEDVKLAVRMHCEFTFKAPPNRDVLARLAAEVNSRPLPTDMKVGLQLPAAKR